MKTIIVGLGNPILGDDGVGWRVAEQVEARLSRFQTGELPTHPVEVDCLAVGGLGLMERLVGYDRAIIIDAISTGQVPAGTVACMPIEDLPEWPPGHSASAHDTSLQEALRVGRVSGFSLPGSIMIVTVEALSLFEFSEELTPPVESAVSRAVQSVFNQLDVFEGNRYNYGNSSELKHPEVKRDGLT